MNDARKVFIIQYVMDCLTIIDNRDSVINDFFEDFKANNIRRLDSFLDGVNTFNDVFVLLFYKRVNVTQKLYKFPVKIDRAYESHEDESHSVKETANTTSLVPPVANESDESKESKEEAAEEPPARFHVVKRVFQTTKLYMCEPPLSDSYRNEEDIPNYVYVVKASLEKLPKCNDLKTANQELSKFVEVGNISARHLTSNIEINKSVYGVLLKFYIQKYKVKDGHKPEKKSKPIRDEFSVALHKYNTIMEETRSNLIGCFSLLKPEFEIPENLHGILSDKPLQKNVRNIVSTWNKQIEEVLTKFNEDRGINDGPLEEVDYWRQKANVLTSVMEELKIQEVQNVYKMWEIITRSTVSYLHDIQNLLYESKDNTRFLLLLERHFKNVQFGTNFEVVNDTLPPMYQSLRLIWTISRNYNKDERMGPLLQRIGFALCDRVKYVMEIATLFSKPIKSIILLATSAIKLLSSFESLYMSERAKVEATSQDNRWEFDRKILFGNSRYMKSICEDIFQMAKCAEEFYRMFGPELKNITGDSQTLQDVLQLVDCLFDPIKTESTPTPFLQKNVKLWNKIKENYYNQVDDIDSKGKKFINDYFSHIHTANSAFDLLEKFKSIQARSAINDLLDEKYMDVLRSYGNELVKIDLLFGDYADNARVTHFSPPIAGSIEWVRLIFHIMKIPIIRFLSVKPQLFDSDEGIRIKNRYLTLGRALRHYEETKYKNWFKGTNHALSTMLSQPILAKKTRRSSKRTETEKKDTEKKDAEVMFINSREDFPVYFVNFHEKLWHTIAEAKMMELLELQIPELSRITGLQEPHYIFTILKLNDILDRYEVIKMKLDDPSFIMLEESITWLLTILERGTFILNWESLPCDEYIQNCEEALTVVENHLNDLEKCNKIIEDALGRLKKMQLFKRRPNAAENIPSAKEYIDYAEKCRDTDCQNLATKVSSEMITGLQRLEEALYNTKSSTHHLMRELYFHYEYKLCKELVNMVTRNLWGFTKSLSEKEIIFYVDAILINADVVLHPVGSDLYKWLTQSIRGCLECTRYFIRWKRGTCIPCPPVRIEQTDQTFVFSHMQEIEKCKDIKEPEISFHQKIGILNKNVIEFLKKLGKYTIMWLQDKQNVVDKWLHKPRTTSQYEQKIINLLNKNRSIQRLLCKDSCFIRIGGVALRVTQLSSSIETNVREWIRIYLRSLLESAQILYYNTEKMIDSRMSVINMEPQNLEEMKQFLINMEEIKGGLSELIDNVVIEIREKYRIIKLYGDDEFLEQIPASEWDFSAKIRQRWDEIQERIKVRMQEILPTKAKFAKQVKESVLAFRERVAEFIRRYRQSGPGNESEDLDRGYNVMSDFTTEVNELEVERLELLSSERLLDLPISTYPELKDIKAEIEKLIPVYDLYVEQKNARQLWSCVLWKNVNTKEMISEMAIFMKRFRAFGKMTKMIPASRAVLSLMKNFDESLILIKNLKNDALRDRHWKQLMETTGISFDIDPETFTLEGVFAMELHRFSEEIAIIVANALRELAIELAIQEIKDIWRELQFKINIYSAPSSAEVIYSLGSIEEIQQLLDDHMMNLQSVGGSKFVIPFLNIVRKLEKDLTTISDTLDTWLVVQRKWMYLESIFKHGDIAKQLPADARRFGLTDKSYKSIMRNTNEVKLVMPCCLAENRLMKLKTMLEELELCQKALNDYLDSKRNAFPRFFFISDDELLSILGGTDPSVVQEHVIKMFDNIATLDMVSTVYNVKMITGMTSAENENMKFRKNVRTDSRIEEWMVMVEEEMRVTNRRITKESVFYYCDRKRRVDWMFDYQGMVVLAASQIWFTWEVEDTFNKMKAGERAAMKEFGKKVLNQISEIVYAVRGGLKKNDMKKLETVLIIDVHSRDIIDGFIRDSITEAEEFEWESQLRFYWVRSIDTIRIKQCSGEFGYGYEYFGLNGRLVITPLTDRIYLTLSQALSMFLGGAPAGPAGTGKTETTKDLAKALGLLCIVTNCGENMDFKSFGKLLNGLCQCGAWGCFDEFNRIDVSVLSVVSTQIKTIQSAIMMKLTVFTFEGQEIKLDSRVGVFITMNPGYAGRTELPESVKALFRPVVVIVPDLEYICEIMLFSQGFLTAKVLAKKMTTIYKLAKEQLSQQYHYDFGLRALKSVLVMAGGIRRENPDVSEEKLLMRALRDMNLPKFVFEDVHLFMGLIQDLFPGIDCPRQAHPKLNEAVAHYFQSSNFEVLPQQVDKVVQFYEILLTRHSVMVVGPTCGGKSTVIKALVTSLNNLNLPTKMFMINPKERTVNELYGTLDPASRDWTDGLLSHIFRQINQPSEKEERRYLLFDGDVDALWIENMNSVMDDNRLLTLVNGERIRLLLLCWLVFEVGDLQYASPATVSRCGMVYVDPKNLGYRPYWFRWLLNHIKTENHECFNKLFDKYIPPLIDLIFEGIILSQQGKALKTVIRQNPLSLVCQFCHILQSQLPQLDDDGAPGIPVRTTDDEEPTTVEVDKDYYEALFLNAIIWSLGASVMDVDRPKFNEVLKQIAALGARDEDETQSVPKGYLPATNPSLFHYMFNETTKLWYPWTKLVPKFEYDAGKRFTEILVPTRESTMTMWVIQKHININVPVLLVGETGTSKTASVLTLMRSLDKSEFSTMMINFSSCTTSLDVQRNLEANVEKRAKGIYGPSPGKVLVTFIDDLSMPTLDKYGTQQPIALLKMLIERGGMYDRGSDLTWKMMKDLSYVGGMGVPGGGRNHVDPRFMSLFSIIYCPNLSPDSLLKIFGSIISGHTADFDESIKEASNAITTMTVKAFESIKAKLMPTPAKFHYTFNLRDLSKIIQGLCQSYQERFVHIKYMIRLWRHECLRVFKDRMITYAEQDIIEEMLLNIIEECFPKTIQYVKTNPILFGDYWNAGMEEEPRTYDDLQDYEVAKSFFQEMMDVYNESDLGSTLDLVLFDDALEHLSSVHRIMRMDGGHSLLVAVSGSGKRSVSRLAAFVAELEYFEISLTKGYGEKEFREDLKNLYNKIAAGKSDFMFLFGDQHVAHEGFLELINNMLTMGMVPTLFQDDEKEALIESVREDAVKNGYQETKEGVWQYFCSVCVARLHIVLNMSPVGDTLRDRCRNFPGVVNNTVIDWFFPWPEQALYAVACYAVDPKNPFIPQQHWEHVVTHLVTVHRSVEIESISFQHKLRRDNYVTATNFMDYIKTYLNLLEIKDSDLKAQGQRLSVGLDKLRDTEIQIKKLNIKLAEQKVIVEEKTIACEKLMVVINQSTAEATVKKKEAEIKSTEVTAQSKVIVKEKAEAEEALSEAMPALEAAKRALDELDKNDVTEIRAFATPPKTVQVVGELLCLVLQAGDVSWKSARGLMADANFIKELQTLDVESIPLKNINGVKDTISKKKLTYEDVRSASKAGGGFLKFIISVVGFYDVAREIRPKRERVKMLEKELMKAKKELEKLQEEVQRLEDQLKALKKQFDDAQDEMERLTKEMQIMQRRLLAAEKLTTGLASEKLRWTQDVAGFQESRKMLLGDCLIASAFLSYLGPFTWEYRQNLIENIWLKHIYDVELPLSKDYKVQKLLTSDVEISKWNSQGLPPDELSIQNAILTTKGSRFPICIDPQEQAIKWIKRMEENKKEVSKSIRVSNFNDPAFLRSLENGIKFGVPFLFQDCDENIDPVIDNVISKNVQKSKGREYVMLGDREVDWEPPFKLYLTSKLGNPRFSPNLYSRALVINYTVTMSGLEGQLLSALVKNERRELEEKRENLIIETSENKRILKELEDKLLLELATQTGNILDNWELINTLEDTKTKAVEVAKQLSQSVIVSADIERQRDGYRSAAKRGALLFFVLTNLSVINIMYQFSLGSYMVVFLKAIRKAMPDNTIKKRLSNIINTLTYHVYCYGCTGIFEKHKLLYSLQLAIRLEEDCGRVKGFEVNFFIKGNFKVGQKLPDKPYDWMPESTWKDLHQLVEVFPRFSDILNDVKENETVWKEWYMLPNPENDIPEKYRDGAENFLRLCFLRCWRIDRIPNAIIEYVGAVMGKDYISPPITTFHAAFVSSTPTVPVVVIISPGSDPPAETVKLANAIDFEVHKIKYLSMGQGQEKNAIALFDTAVSRGQWLMLQNTHLLIRFIPTIEKKLDELVKPHPDFRLWMTTEPVSTFPVGILQKSYKIVMEPPSGLKQNLKGTYAKMANEVFLDCPHPKYRQCIFPLAFLHAILQERRRFGKIGWNVPYDFAESDFLVSLKILQTYLTKAHETNSTTIPWNTIKYLIGEVMYGGRAIDVFDRRILKTYMDEYFGDFLFDEFQPFHFYEDDFVEYYIPEEPEECSTLKEIYTEYIASLPHDQSPCVFGLHENSLIGYSTQFTKELWQNMIELTPEISDNSGGEGSSEGGSKESVIHRIVRDLLQTLPEVYDVPKIQKNLTLAGTVEIQPTCVVLLQELDRFNRLLKKMKVSLQTLEKALKGEAAMSNELDDVSRCLGNGQLPNSWRMLAPATTKMLGSWLEHLRKRRQQYDKWIEAGKVDLPLMWLSGLQLPESYLTALIQKACRRNQWALDNCTLNTYITKLEVSGDQITESNGVKSATLTPEFGCYTYGFYLEGCGWDIENGCVARQKNRQLLQIMPIIQLQPVEIHKYKTTNTIRVPVYVTSQRRNAMGVGLVTELDLYTTEHTSHWILQGIALTLNSDE